jgi:hypothetical protein
VAASHQAAPGWVVALKEPQPIALSRRPGASRPEGPKLIALVQLVGNLVPEEVFRAVAAIERGDAGAAEGRAVLQPCCS